MHRDKEVFVVGGGNTAVEEALHLASIAKKVTFKPLNSKQRKLSQKLIELICQFIKKV